MDILVFARVFVEIRIVCFFNNKTSTTISLKNLILFLRLIMEFEYRTIHVIVKQHQHILI